MANYQPVSRERHAAKRWRRYTTYLFAAKESVAPVVMAELPAVVMKLPIGFVSQNEQFVPVVVLGLAPGQNLWVAPDGKWLGGYVPAFFRSNPFRLANTQEGQAVLCVDEDSGLVVDGTEGEAFFDEKGGAAAAIQQVLDFLTKTAQSQQATQVASAALQRHGVLKPWPIKVQTGQGDVDVTGLFQVDEGALNALPAEALLDLRQAGALVLAYTQLLSMQHLGELGRLAELHARLEQQRIAAEVAKRTDLQLDFMSQSDTIDFSRL